MSTYRTITLIITLSLTFLCIPLAVLIYTHTPITLEHIQWLVVAIGFGSLSIAGWRLKRGLKSRMKRGLGREIRDDELPSIATWMEIPDQAARAGREAEKYDFEAEQK